jgi:integrase
MQEFMKTLRTKEGIAAKALDFAILTAARSGEVRQADWSEINLTEKTWTVPAARMKAKREHRVPLSDAAIRILKALPHREGLIFIGAKKDRPMSDGTLAAVLKRMKRDDITVHGFRSSFRDWVSEKTNYDSATAEAALAHVVGDRIEAAYRRGDLFEKRRAMMADWARYCMNGETAKVVELTVRR